MNEKQKQILLINKEYISDDLRSQIIIITNSNNLASRPKEVIWEFDNDILLNNNEINFTEEIPKFTNKETSLIIDKFLIIHPKIKLTYNNINCVPCSFTYLLHNHHIY